MKLRREYILKQSTFKKTIKENYEQIYASKFENTWNGSSKQIIKTESKEIDQLIKIIYESELSEPWHINILAKQLFYNEFYQTFKKQGFNFSQTI